MEALKPIKPPKELRKELDAELRLDERDLRSRPWYHGKITRHLAERLVAAKKGSFLIRDCISKPGDFVLTCSPGDRALHFVITGVVEYRPEFKMHVTYSLEGGATFNSLEHLVRFYLDTRQCLSQTASADVVLATPVHRCLPLSYYDSKYFPITNPKLKLLRRQYSGGQPAEMTSDASASTGVKTIFRRFQKRRDALMEPQVFAANDPADYDNVAADGEACRPQLPLSSWLPPEATFPRTGSAPSLPDCDGHQTALVANLQLTSSNPNLDTAPPKPTRMPSIKIKHGPTWRPPRGTPKHHDYDELPDVVEDDGGPAASSSMISSPYAKIVCLSRAGGRQGFMPELESPATAGSVVPMTCAMGGSARVRSPVTGSSSPVDVSHPKGGGHRATTSPATSGSTIAPTLVGKTTPARVTQPIILPYTPVTAKIASARLPYKRTPSSSDGGGAHAAIAKIPYTRKQRADPKMASVKLSSPVALAQVPPLWSQTPAASDRGKNRVPHDPANTEAPSMGDISCETLRSSNLQFDYDVADEFPARLASIADRPAIYRQSELRVGEFRSALLPVGNKPLNSDAMNCIKTRLSQTKPSMLAAHLLKSDCDLLLLSASGTLGLGLTSGLELIALPQGSQLRQNLLERWRCLQMFVSATLLRCLDDSERCSMLNVWIQVAAQCRTNFGDLFGFTAIIRALCAEPISRLTKTWERLRSTHTDSAFQFESKFRPLMLAMMAGRYLGLNDDQRVCVPFIVPFIYLLEIDDVSALARDSEWDCSFEAIVDHLEAGRAVAKQGFEHHENAIWRLSAMHVDAELMEIFRTEMHMCLLWGARGACADRTTRYDKFNRVLGAMSQSVEP